MMKRLIFLSALLISLCASASTQPLISIETPSSSRVSGQSFEIIVALSQPAPQGQTVSATIETQDLRARSGVDYVPLVRSVIFSPGEVVKRVEVQTIQNLLLSQERDFVVKLSDVTGAILEPRSPIMTITPFERLAFRLNSYYHADSPRDNGKMEFIYNTEVLPLDLLEDENGLFYQSNQVTPELYFEITNAGELDTRGGDFQVIRLDSQDPNQPLSARNVRLHYAWGQNKGPECHFVMFWQPCFWNGIYNSLHSFEHHPQNLVLPGYNYVVTDFKPVDDHPNVLARRTYFFEKEGLTERTTIELIIAD